MLVIKVKGIENTINDLKNLDNLYSNPTFIDFIKRKCMGEVKHQTSNRLKIFEMNANNPDFVSEYQSNHKIENTPTGFVLYNDLSREWVNYNFSIAQAVEYGVGIVGQGSGVNASEDGWVYDMKGHGEEGWAYYNDDGKLVFTSGYRGRNVYYFTYLAIMSKIDGWVGEFLESELI